MAEYCKTHADLYSLDRIITQLSQLGLAHEQETTEWMELQHELDTCSDNLTVQERACETYNNEKIGLLERLTTDICAIERATRSIRLEETDRKLTHAYRCTETTLIHFSETLAGFQAKLATKQQQLQALIASLQAHDQRQPQQEAEMIQFEADNRRVLADLELMQQNLQQKIANWKN